jgi:surface protein
VQEILNIPSGIFRGVLDIGSSWNVSNVTNMNYMFFSATNLNGNISNWDVSHVTNMACMFFHAGNFNENISSWDVSHVTNMDCMFSGAISRTCRLGMFPT